MKTLDLDYMKDQINKAMRVKTGLRAGKNDKPKKNKPDVTLKYGITPEPVLRYAISIVE